MFERGGKTYRCSVCMPTQSGQAGARTQNTSPTTAFGGMPLLHYWIDSGTYASSHLGMWQFVLDDVLPGRNVKNYFTTGDKALSGHFT